MGLPSALSRVPRSPQEESERIKQLVSFRIGEEEFGVDILMVQEIIRLPIITPIPNAPPYIEGMINLRGRIIPVIDLRQRLRIHGKTPTGSSRKTRVLIVEMQTHVTGFIVDAVTEVMKVRVSEIEPTPQLVVSNIDAEYIKGVIKLPSRLVVLLDFHRVLKPQEEKEVREMDMSAIESSFKQEVPELSLS